MITLKQQKQVDYMNQAVANMKTPKQELAIELQERDKRLARREELQKNIKKTPRKIFINSRKGKFQDKFVLEHEITTEDEIAEIELWFAI